MRGAGLVGYVGVCTESKRVQHGLDLVLLDGGEERLVWCTVARERGRERRHVGAVNVLGCYELEALVAGCLWGRLERWIETSFPDGVGDAVADGEEELDDVGGEGGDVEG